MKPLNEMSDKEFEAHLRTIAPVLPIWAKDGAVVLERYTESFVDRVGNKAVLSMVSWRDKKNKVHKSVHCVKWGI